MKDRILTGHEVFLIWGVGVRAQRLCDFFPNLPVKAFIDSDIKKQGTVVRGLDVISYETAKKDYPNAIIVVSMLRGGDVCNFLLENNYKRNVDFYTIQEFIPIYSFYIENKLSMVSLIVVTNNTCSLKCDGCLFYVHLADRKLIRPLEDVKKDTDLLFSQVDRVMTFCICSGEPLLYPHIVDYIEYLNDKYIYNCHLIFIITNGTIIPKEKQLLRLSKCKKIRFSISDYSDRLADGGEKLKKLITELKRHNIEYFVNTSGIEEKWDDIGNPELINDTDEELLKTRYNNCTKVSAYGLYGGKLFQCCPETMAHINMGTDIYEEDYYDLTDEPDKQKLRNIIFKNSPQGYLEFCKHCKGRPF